MVSEDGPPTIIRGSSSAGRALILSFGPVEAEQRRAAHAYTVSSVKARIVGDSVGAAHPTAAATMVSWPCCCTLPLDKEKRYNALATSSSLRTSDYGGRCVAVRCACKRGLPSYKAAACSLPSLDLPWQKEVRRNFPRTTRLRAVSHHGR